MEPPDKTLSIIEQGREINRQYAAQQRQGQEAFAVLEGRIKNGKLEFLVDIGGGAKKWLKQEIAIEIQDEGGSVLEIKMKDTGSAKTTTIKLPSHSHSARVRISWAEDG